MGRLGFGYRRQCRSVPQGGAVLVRPGLAWTGVAGSGFAVAPADPVRTTAKPACRLIVPPNQYFTDGKLVGVAAGANYNSSLLENMGLLKIIVHYEGTTCDILQPSWQELVDANGGKRRYFGWWARLAHDGRNGHANVYFEAVPRDATMQRRVIGPYQFSPQAAKHDYSVTVTPSQPVIAGSRYQTVQSAVSYLTSVAAHNPLVTITEEGLYEIGTPAARTGHQGWLHITATAPITIRKTSYTSYANARLGTGWRNGTHFYGSNITIDFEKISAVLRYDRDNWFDGVQCTNSQGRSHSWNKQTRPYGFVFEGNPWLTEVRFDNVPDAGNTATLARGCSFTRGYGDIVAGSNCAVHNTVSDWDSTIDWQKDVASCSVIYTGTETTATLTRSTQGAKRRFTATWGANVATFDADKAETAVNGGFYTVQNFVNWINSLAGWSATLIDDTRTVYNLAKPGEKDVHFSSLNCKGVAQTLVTCFDLHTDFYQHRGTFQENCLIAFNKVTNYRGQSIFISNANEVRDWLIFNNAFHTKVDDELSYTGYAKSWQVLSQLSQVSRHLVLLHNSWSDQRVKLNSAAGFNPDTYCVLANNVSNTLLWDGPPDADLTLSENHIQEGGAVPAGAIGTTFGGDRFSLFANAASGDFAPRGALLAYLRPPRLIFDHGGGRRATAGACAGAVR